MPMKIVGALQFCLLTGIIAIATTSPAAIAQNIRGSATGPTTAKGYDHPDQLHSPETGEASRQHVSRYRASGTRATGARKAR